jgi:Ca-activated chloride channel family protein
MKALSFLPLFFSLFLSIHLSAQNTDVLFILDGSGSMWQKLEGEYKIATAKTVMKKLVAEMPESTRAGLIAYGHNRKSDCEDIETLVALAPLNKAAFQAKLDGINPMGKTPIARSLKQALAQINSQEEPVNVILVSDGLETCEGDACEIVRQAKAQGVKITVHVVGFGISEQDLSALECIAQAGGGQYLPANNAEELTDALDKTVEEAPKEGGVLSVKATLDGELLDAAVRVFPKGSDQEITAGRTYSGPGTNPRLLLLPAGTYEATVEAIPIDGRPTQRLTNLVISGNTDTLKHEVDFTNGTIKVLVTRNEELSDATVNVYHAGTKKWIEGGRTYKGERTNPLTIRLVPGNYDVEIGSVEIRGKPGRRWENIQLGGKEEVSLEHHFKSGELKAGGKQGDQLVDCILKVYQNGPEVASHRTYQSASSIPKSFILEPGTYEVKLQPIKPKGLNSQSKIVEVKAEQTVEWMGEW